MKLSVHLVTWNGAKYIPHLFDSLKKQTCKDWELIVWDNASTDGTIDILKKELLHFPIQYTFFEHDKNIGFAGGHNELFKKTDSHYFLLLNQDMYLMPDCLFKMVHFLDVHQDVASVSPRLMRWDFKNIDFADLHTDFTDSKMDSMDRIQKTFTHYIDSLGLKVFRNRRVIEKYARKDWRELESKMKMSFRAERFNGDGTALEVFGVSGAFPLFRREMISHVLFSDGNFLDTLYGSYKEDVDLAFRLRSQGFKSYVLLDTVAYHDRSGTGPEQMSDVAAIKNKRAQSAWIKYHSYKNHLMTLYKNEYWQNYLLDAVFIKWYELKKFFYFLLFDRAVLKGLGEIWKHRAELKAKRFDIKNKRKVSWKEMRRWWM
ncbi:MAG: glycosyltransferase family 2 protein [Candidatus Magasanikbacteria bacterium]|nr:glycosyltransferase family 2 protein [Candidatus Magasanikbacteria bacterium]